MIDGPFTNQGLAGLAGLDGVLELDLFWHVTGITSDGFVHLAQMRNLGSLGCDGKLSDDTAMRHIAAIPRLRRLRAQESVARDAGFEALSESRTLGFLLGRECANFGSRGFIALSKMPKLRGFGISCNNVEDSALARLPDFPALRELTPKTQRRQRQKTSEGRGSRERRVRRAGLRVDWGKFPERRQDTEDPELLIGVEVAVQVEP